MVKVKVKVIYSELIIITQAWISYNELQFTDKKAADIHNYNVTRKISSSQIKKDSHANLSSGPDNLPRRY